MKKICYITTVSMTLNAFVLKSAEYIHNHTDWDITFICSEDAEFASRLPSYIHFHPIHMKRGISLSGIKAMIQMKRLFTKEKYDLIQYSTPNASLYA
ncbi:MAG: glycosyltransferase family 1 protein, partial [Lachnospiraceae bacterium]|nr:glycosyltransferase family 1 protein [Lachnospiraceae bacterium]